jgi:hypothetical protein
MFAFQAGEFRLKTSSEDLIYDAVAIVVVIRRSRGSIPTVPMKYIQSSNEELVSVLLFIAS